MNAAIIFPGQGSQRLKMLNDYYNTFDKVKKMFQQASDILEYNLWDIIQNDPIKLNKTEYTQIAIFTASIAIWNVLYTESNINVKIFSGHSLGEYSALCAANSITFIDSLKILQMRAKLMKEAVKNMDTGMSVILGLNHYKIIECCNIINEMNIGIVEVANLNSPKQIVISGDIKAIHKANNLAKNMGAKKTKILPISIASHCSLMKIISKKFSSYLKNINITLPQIPIIHNYDNKIHNNIKNIKRILVKQLYSPIYWNKIIDKITKNNNINIIIECGPNNILSTISKKNYPDILYKNTSNINQLREVIK